jgi:uncharacterized coiled-coil protein SlyX
VTFPRLPDVSEDRLIRIESALMELQRQVELLNEALLDQQKEFYGIQTQVKRIESLANEWSDPQRSAADERPPHY